MKEEIERLKEKAIEEALYFARSLWRHRDYTCEVEFEEDVRDKLHSHQDELEKAVREEERTRWETAVKYNVDDETLQRIEEAIKVLTNK